MSDPGHEYSEREIAAFRKEAASLFVEAARDAEGALSSYMSKFEKQDEEKRRLVASGDLSEADWVSWRQGKITGQRQYQATLEQAAWFMTNSTTVAMNALNGKLPGIYAENFNYGMFTAETKSGVGTTYTLLDGHTVQNLLRGSGKYVALVEPSTPIEKNLLWNKGNIGKHVTQGILLGEDVRKIARRVSREVGASNMSSAMRIARTTATAAQNAGRVSSYMHALELGIEGKKEWLAAIDERTRASHRHVNGEQVEVEGTFSNGCEYPGDPNAPYGEIANCRCTLVFAVAGDDYDEVDDEEYEDWKLLKELGSPTYTELESGHVFRADSMYSYRELIALKRVKENFEELLEEDWLEDYEREDVKNELAKIEKFYRSVAKYKRTAEDVAARKTLRSLDAAALVKEYLSISDKGLLRVPGSAQLVKKAGLDPRRDFVSYADAQYYVEKIESLKDLLLSENGGANGIKESIREMEAFIEAGKRQKELDRAIKYLKKTAPEKITDAFLGKASGWKRRPSEYEYEINDVFNYLGNDGLPRVVSKAEFSEIMKNSKFIAQRTYVGKDKAQADEFREMLYSGEWYVSCQVGGSQYGQGMYCAADYSGRLSHGITEEMRHYGEINKRRISLIHGRSAEPVAYTETMTLDPSAKIISYDEAIDLWSDWQGDFMGVTGIYSTPFTDIGSFCAAMGYDAINAERHGSSGSYTVILNRTKLIIEDGRGND